MSCQTWATRRHRGTAYSAARRHSRLGIALGAPLIKHSAGASALQQQQHRDAWQTRGTGKQRSYERAERAEQVNAVTARASAALSGRADMDVA